MLFILLLSLLLTPVDSLLLTEALMGLYIWKWAWIYGYAYACVYVYVHVYVYVGLQLASLLH